MLFRRHKSNRYQHEINKFHLLPINEITKLKSEYQDNNVTFLKKVNVYSI